MKKYTKDTIPNLSGIYQIQSIINGKRYIGSAINLRERKNVHFCNLKKNKHHCTKLQHHYNKYGENDLQFSILEFCPIRSLIKHEQYYIDIFHLFSNIGHPLEFNISPIAGSALGVKWSEETKQKHRGINNPLYGTHFSESHKANMRGERECMKGKNVLLNKPEIRQSIIDANSKPVAQYDLDGNLIKTYKSRSDAHLQTGAFISNISNCCNNKRIKTSRNSIWRNL
jgi:group I intron endonuclease